METTRIIMTECKSVLGSRYVDFKEKDTGRRVGEVDRVGQSYIIYASSGGYLKEVATRSRKPSAISYLQNLIRDQYAGAVEFKWNVMREIYKSK